VAEHVTGSLQAMLAAWRQLYWLPALL